MHRLKWVLPVMSGLDFEKIAPSHVLQEGVAPSINPTPVSRVLKQRQVMSTFQSLRGEKGQVISSSHSIWNENLPRSAAKICDK